MCIILISNCVGTALPTIPINYLAQNLVKVMKNAKIRNRYNQSMKGGKDQGSKQSSTTPNPGYQWESDTFTIRDHKRQEVSLSQQVTTRHQ